MITKQVDFSRRAMNRQCLVMERSKGPKEDVYVIGMDEANSFEICTRGAQEIAMAIGWLPEQEIYRRVQEVLESQAPPTPDEKDATILALSNELAVVAATRDDAISQFQELEKKMKKDAAEYRKEIKDLRRAS